MLCNRPVIAVNVASFDDELVRDILSYLAENPEAHDTLEGIVEWWMLQRDIRRQVNRVRLALSLLVAQGFVIEELGPDQLLRYRTNQSRLPEIRKVLFGSGGSPLVEP